MYYTRDILEEEMISATTNFATNGKRLTQHQSNQWTLLKAGGEEKQKIVVATHPWTLLLPACHLDDNIALKKELFFNASNFICVEEKEDTYKEIVEQCKERGLNLSYVLLGDFFWVFYNLVPLFRKLCPNANVPSYESLGHIDADLIQCFDLQCLKFIEDCIKLGIPSIHLTIDTHRGRDDFKAYMYEKYGFELTNTDQKEKIERVLQHIVPAWYEWCIIPYNGIGKSNMLMVLLQQL